MKNQLRVMFLAIKYNIMRQMENKVTFFTNVIFMILNDATFIIQWMVLFNIKEDFGGYKITDVLVLWGLAALTFGISRLLFARAFNLSDLIINGKLDSYLVQPKNVLISVITSDTSISALGDILYGIIVVLFCKITFTQFMLFLLFGITGAIIVTNVSIIANCISFKFVKGDVIGDTVQNIMVNFATYPDTIFKNTVKLILYTIVPVGLVAYMPLHVIIKFDLASILIILAVTILTTLLSFGVFRLGLKKYSSSNLMGAR